MAPGGLKLVTGIVTWTFIFLVVMRGGNCDEIQSISRFLSVAISRLRNISHVCDDEFAELHNALDIYNVPASDEQGCHVMTRTMECHGDEDCTTYGSCCLYRVPVEPPHPDMECLHHSGRSTYMLNSCPEGWEKSDVRRLCERQDAAAADQPFTWLPVTSNVTNRTYSNYYCALCRSDIKQYAPWTPTVQCHIPGDVLRSLNASYIWKNLRRRDGQWGVDIGSANKTTFYQCNLDFKPNDLPTVACGEADRCGSVMPIVDRVLCNVDMWVYDKSNCTGVHCELCDTFPCGVITSTLTTEHDEQGTTSNRTALFVLDTRDNGTSGAVGDEQPCEQWQVWSPFYGGECLNVSCNISDSRLVGGRCVPLIQDGGYFELYDKLFWGILFHLGLNFRVLDVWIVISLLCFVVSLVCLVLHICAFLVGILERNLPAMCVTSMAVCQLVIYLQFVVAWTPPGSPECHLLAVVTLIALVASLCWTNVMGFDLFMTLRRAHHDLRVVRGPRLRRFACYSLYVWTLTAVIVGTAVLIDHIPGIPEQYRPGFGETACGISRPLPFYIFFIAPVAVAMASNGVLYIAIARLIRRMRAASTESSSQPSNPLRLFTRLSVMMGFWWIVFLLSFLHPASITLVVLWVVLYTMQGIFIFASFTTTRSARAWLHRRVTTCDRILCERLCQCLRHRGDSPSPDGCDSEDVARPTDGARGAGHAICTRTTRV